MGRVVGVIPSRYGSSRFPGKPLVSIAGRPLLEWVVEGTRASKSIQQILVATDDERIADLCKKINVDFVMTPSELPTGTDRVKAALKNIDADIVINIQGDEPLITGDLLDQLAQPLIDDLSIDMATLGRKITQEDLLSKTTAKIVLNQNHEALYFSRFAIPYSRQPSTDLNACLKHIGIYGYRRSFLEKFCSHKPVAIELAESLEQLRALYLGARIKVIEVESDSWGVDTPGDIQKVESKLMAKKRGVL